jgi:SET domain-containing protein
MPNRTLLVRKKRLYLKKVPAKGYGVFCREDIKRGEILEVTPAIILNEKDQNKVSDTFLDSYVFQVGKISKQMRKWCHVKDVDGAAAVVMGILSFCNHDEAPNAEILWEEKKDLLFYMLRATRDIKKNTEVCTSYGKDWFEDRK